jgi:hypothetical protein
MALKLYNTHMTLSFDYDSYLEHKPFFDMIALSNQKNGGRVGIITGVREIEYDQRTRRTTNKKEEMIRSLGFTPDFVHLWGENETIANGNLWKCYKLDEEDVLVHFDDDATELKKYTGRWILKVLVGGQEGKF